MKTTTQDKQHALDILESFADKIQSDKALLLITQELGKGQTDYLRVMITYQTPDYPHPLVLHLTWAMAKHFGYSLRDRNGRWYLAIGGGGFSKPDELARTLANYYQVERIRYEVL